MNSCIAVLRGRSEVQPEIDRAPPVNQIKRYHQPNTTVQSEMKAQAPISMTDL